MKVRQAARVVLLNEAGDVFLLRVSDLYDPASHRWMTCGGGADLGESPLQTAARELAEETGLECDPCALIGPIAEHTVLIEYSDRSFHQHEVFYGLRIDEDLDLDDAVWTDTEKKTIDQWRWWPRSELDSTGETVYPARLGELVDLVHRGETPAVPLDLGDSLHDLRR
ncbi:NUDIX hydrolase [Brevibacterium samyangense]|uniref:Nudix hydrolase domain-containing protein n=1 Tax=Brevibacterium samyangense TaxID=366888 RepID=A0ABP5EYT2_9MICO